METVRELLSTLYRSKKTLQAKGVIRSERFTGELGEWLVEVAYQGRRASATSQRGWDVELKTTSTVVRLQVKTHAKGKRNKARWTEIRPDCLDHFDRLVIVVLSDDYFIKEWFDVPNEALRTMLKQSGKSLIVRWDDAKAYATNITTLPGAAALTEFNTPHPLLPKHHHRQSV